MKTIKEKQLLVGADFAGYPLKEAVCAYLRAKGWTITDVGVTDPDSEDTENMFHRVGLRVGALISEGEFERALVFCGTGMGMSLIANRFKGVRAAAVESVFAAKMCRTINDANVLCMGQMIWGDMMAVAAADAFLDTKFTEGLEGLAPFLHEAAKKVEAIDGR